MRSLNSRHLRLLLAFFPFVLSGCSTTPTTLILDREAERLCSKDAGTTVYRTATLPDEFFDAQGFVYRFKEKEPVGPDYEYERDYTMHSNTGGAYIERSEERIVARKTGEVLARTVMYLRIGGTQSPFDINRQAIACRDRTYHFNRQLARLVFMKAPTK